MVPAVPLESLDYILGFTSVVPQAPLPVLTNKRPNTTFDCMEFISWDGVTKIAAESPAVKAPSKKRRRTEVPTSAPAQVPTTSAEQPSHLSSARTNALVAQWLSVGEWNNLKTAPRTSPAFHTELCGAANALGLGLNHEYEAHEACTNSCTECCHVSAASEENHKHQQRLIAQTQSLLQAAPTATTRVTCEAAAPKPTKDGPRGLGEVDNGVDSSDCVSFLGMQLGGAVAAR
mmetsp:Transcript_34520/g.59307  ORF Transcript_34520/g.59307 Transcript_34520/m.59307 type:complete len:232 (+) Transcript_34520:83-778(+)|eukprot:CAMPEP_0205946820 /NCGR_PEP_ID=MMETSP1325-20131115/69242_1 /ASSEMBLY_ACC=CAM_ASM_000708 /TAXON_ID=236786 /ORGANISM="Florenciella sp., Strain RCC1007" /LENGTH=231 /DNA_ID=CAMNT_0053317909 /DNA_START=538 /DNA_END=1233 /DNA_ORIENTATION=+